MKIIRKNFLKKSSSLLCILTLVMSLIVVSSLGSQAANAQTADGCEKLPIANVSASRETSSSKAQFVIDNDPNTRWRHQAEGAYVQLELTQPTIMCSIDIMWYDAHRLSYNFVVSISDDGLNFEDVISAKSTSTTSPERYNLPDISARFVKVTVNGNSKTDLASILEMQVNGQVNGQVCKIPQITSVNTIGDSDGNIPQNTLDGNLNTKWLNFGLPSWIQYNLDESRPICNVDIAWYRGNLRVNTFTIAVSNDGINFTPVFSGQSSGSTIGLERYDVRGTVGKYIRITVTGNTEISGSSISEVRINGAVTPTQTPTQTPDPTGSDQFGIKMIYPTKANGEEWFMDMSDGMDPRSDPEPLTKNSDGSFKVTSTKVRHKAFTTSGYDSNKIETLDHSILAQKGYTQSPNDWRDVEMTGYVKVNEGNIDDDFVWYARSGRHTGSGWPEGCEGASYKATLSIDGTVRFAKEQWHVSYAFTDKKGAMSPIQGQWVGFKTIMYNIEENGETAVKMEIWLDKNNDGDWVMVDENIDRGGWGDEDGECHGDPDQIITWGGPIATFRWDGATDVDIKNFSVREIQPPS